MCGAIARNAPLEMLSFQATRDAAEAVVVDVSSPMQLLHPIMLHSWNKLACPPFPDGETCL
jgi:hypothetical protein